MKKVAWIITMMVCVIIFGSCSNIVRYDLMQKTDQIVSIQIAEGISEKDAVDAKYDKIKVMASIPGDQWESFLNDFWAIKCSRYRNDPCQSLEGYIIWITYTDGAIELIGDSATFYHQVGSEKRGYFRPFYFDLDQFNALIAQYIAD